MCIVMLPSVMMSRMGSEHGDVAFSHDMKCAQCLVMSSVMMSRALCVVMLPSDIMSRVGSVCGDVASVMMSGVGSVHSDVASVMMS